MACTTLEELGGWWVGLQLGREIGEEKNCPVKKWAIARKNFIVMEDD